MRDGSGMAAARARDNSNLQSQGEKQRTLSQDLGSRWPPHVTARTALCHARWIAERYLLRLRLPALLSTQLAIPQGRPRKPTLIIAASARCRRHVRVQRHAHARRALRGERSAALQLTQRRGVRVRVRIEPQLLNQ